MTTRRHFIRQITGSVITVSLLPQYGSAMNTGAPVLRVAIMGLGSYGSRVAEAMKKSTRAKLVGVISGTPGKIKDWQARYGLPDANCYNYSNFDEIRTNKDIDAVYVITPNALHREQVKRVAAAGKHVICEKPMALNAAEAREMIDACDRAKVHLLVGYRMHFEAKTLEVIRMRNAGEFGNIKFFQGLSGFSIGDPAQWRLNKALSGGGAMMDIGIYSVNGCRYMIGEEPVWVTAQETKTDPQRFKEGIDETIQFQLGFPGGAVASCLSTYAMNNLDRFFIDGEKGYAELLPATGYGPIIGHTHKGALTQPDLVQQAVQMDEMAAIILDGTKPILPVDGHEALKDMKIIDAIYEAARTGTRRML